MATAQVYTYRVKRGYVWCSPKGEPMTHVREVRSDDPGFKAQAYKLESGDPATPPAVEFASGEWEREQQKRMIGSPDNRAITAKEKRG